IIYSKKKITQNQISFLLNVHKTKRPRISLTLPKFQQDQEIRNSIIKTILTSPEKILAANTKQPSASIENNVSSLKIKLLANPFLFFSECTSDACELNRLLYPSRRKFFEQQILAAIEN